MIIEENPLSNLYWKAVWEFKKLNPYIDTEALLIGDDRPLWVDVSDNQGKMDLSIMKANRVLGIAARAGRTWYHPSFYKDLQFDSVWLQAEQNNLFRTSYHVIHTDKDIIAQTNLWYSVHPVRDIIPRWIDLEVDRGDHPANKAEKTWKMVETVEARDGVPPTIYSRYLLVNAWLVPYWTVEQLNHVTWALAQYMNDRTVEHPGPPTLPIGVREDRVLYHQTADKIPPWDGAAESWALDRDRWTNGTEREMRTYIINNWGGEPDLPPFPIGDTMPLQDVMLKSKIAFHTSVSLTGVNQDTAITIPDLPNNVRGLKLWMIVKSDKPGAFVFFSPGKFGDERYHIGARSQVSNLEVDEIGDLLLDGKTFYRQHDAKGGTVTYWLFITGYKVEAPEIDLSEINTKLQALQTLVDNLQNLNIDSRLKAEEAVTNILKSI